MLIQNAKVFYLDGDGYIKPKFKHPPTIFITPMSKDVEQFSVQFDERWAMIGSGGNGELENLLMFSNKCDNGKVVFEVSFKLSVPCEFYGSGDKSGWHGVCIKRSAEEKAHFKRNYWKHLTIGKASPKKRFDKAPLIRNHDSLRK